MKKTTVKLRRFAVSGNSRQILGQFFLPIPARLKKDRKNKRFYTLEPSWENNYRFISCVKADTYKVKKRKPTDRIKHYHWILEDKHGRDTILIHKGNYRENTQGCILVGLHLGDINGDGIMDLSDSLGAMRYMNEILPDEWELEIIDVNGVGG